MPLKIDAEDIQEYRKKEFSHVCAECGGRMLVRWGGHYGIESYIFACSTDVNHEGFARHYEPSPYDIPGWNLSNLKRTEVKGMTKALAKYENKAALTKEEAKEIITTIWPKAPDTEIYKAMTICAQYRLNPLMKHVYLIPFKDQWVTVLGIKATRLIALQQGKFSYLDDTPRLMSDDEQEKIFGKVDKSKIWAITKLRDKEGNVYPGYGNWPANDSPYGTDKGNTAFNMACIRSERQAFDRMNPGMLPTEVEVGAEEFMPEITIEEPEPVERQVDPETGEIVDGEPKPNGSQVSNAEYKKILNKAKKDAGIQPEPQPQAVTPENSGVEVETGKFPKPRRDPGSIRTLGDLFTACKNDFGMNASQVVKELGYSAKEDISETPAECYVRIVAVRT